MKVLLFLSLALPLLAQEPPPAPADAPAPLRADPANDLYTAAQLAYSEGLEQKDENARKVAFGNALRTFERFITNFPNDRRVTDSRFYIASCHEKLGNRKEADEAFAKLANSSATGPLAEAAALKLAGNYYKNRQYEKAEPYFARVARLATKPETRHLALYNRALCLQHLDRTDDLKEALRQVVFDDDSPYSEKARSAISALYVKTGEPDRALSNYKILAKSKDAQIADDAILQSAILARELKLGEANTWFAAIMNRPGLTQWHGKAQLTLMTDAFQAKNYQAVIDLQAKGNFPLEKAHEAQRLAMAAESHRQLGNTKAADELLARLAKIAPDQAQAFDASYVILTRQYAANDPNFVKSARDFLNRYQQSHAADGRIDNTRMMLGEKNYAAKNFPEAVKLYQTIDLAKIDASNVPGLRYRLAYSLLKAGDRQKARDAFTVFLSKHPQDARVNRAIAHRASLQSSLGATEAAMTDYLTLRKNADTPELKLQALTGLAKIFRKKENYPELVNIHTLLLRDFPKRSAREQAASHFVLGWAYFHQEMSDEAVPHFRKARELNPKGLAKDATLHLVLIAFAKEDEATLKVEMDRLLNESPASDLPRPVLAWLGAKASAAENHEEAWKYLSRAITREQPEQTKIAVWKAYSKSAEALGKYEECLFATDYLIPQEKSAYLRALLLHRKAKAQLGLKRYDLATASAEEGLELKPQGDLNGQLRLTLGDIYRAQNQLGEALKHYVTVAEIIGKEETRKLALRKAIGIYQEKGDAASLAEVKRYEGLLKE